MFNKEANVFFETYSGSAEKVKKLQDRSERYDWELCRCSPFSKEPVNNEEFVYRQAPSPLFYDSLTGKLTPTAFDEVFNRGCSVDRESHASIDEIYQRGFERVKKYNAENPEKPERIFSAVAKLSCAEVRSHVLNGVRSMGIYDTALEENRSHAEICQLSQPSKASKRSIRSHLFSIAQTLTLQAD